MARQILSLIGMMLRYGSKTIFHDEETQRDITAGEYILSELDKDGIEATDVVCQRIMDEYRTHMHDEDFQPDVYFSTHENLQIAQLAQRLLTQRYRLSRIYSRQRVSENITQEVHIPTDEEMLDEMLPKMIYELKHNIISQQKDVIIEKMQQVDIEGGEKVDDLLIQLQQLNNIDRILADELRRPIS